VGPVLAGSNFPGNSGNPSTKKTITFRSAAEMLNVLVCSKAALNIVV
jgi:hypothetical protein